VKGGDSGQKKEGKEKGKIWFTRGGQHRLARQIKRGKFRDAGKKESQKKKAAY